MKDDNQEQIEQHIRVEIESPTEKGEESSSLLGSIFNLFTPSASPASVELDRKQKEEVRRHKDEISALREELRRKQHELETRILEINHEREEHKREKEAAIQAAIAQPPSYPSNSVIFSSSSSSFAELVADSAEESLSMPSSLFMTDGGETGQDDSREESKASIESSVSVESQIRLLEGQTTQQLSRITELTNEIAVLNDELEEQKKKNAIQAAKIAILTVNLERQRRKNEEDEADKVQSIERERRAREDAERLLAQKEIEKRAQELRVQESEAQAVKIKIEIANTIKSAKDNIGF